MIENLANVARKCVATTGTVALRTELNKATSFVPDFTARITQDVVYLLVKASTYLNAFRSSVVSQGQEFPNLDLWLTSQSQLGSRTTLLDGTENEQKRKQSINLHSFQPGSFDDNSSLNAAKISLPPRKISGRSEGGRKYLRSMSITSVEKYLASMFGGAKSHPLSQEDLHHQVVTSNALKQQEGKNLLRANSSM